MSQPNRTSLVEVSRPSPTDQKPPNVHGPLRKGIADDPERPYIRHRECRAWRNDAAERHAARNPGANLRYKRGPRTRRKNTHLLLHNRAVQRGPTAIVHLTYLATGSSCAARLPLERGHDSPGSYKRRGGPRGATTHRGRKRGTREKIHHIVLAQIDQSEPESGRIAPSKPASERPGLGEQLGGHHRCGEVQRGHRSQWVASKHTVEGAPAVFPEELSIFHHHPPDGDVV